MTTDTRSTVARLREMAEKATPGHWVDQSPDDGAAGEASEWWIDTHAYADGPEPVVARSYPLRGADAAFIVALVNAAPALLAVVEAAERLSAAERVWVAAGMPGSLGGLADDAAADLRTALDALEASHAE